MCIARKKNCVSATIAHLNVAIQVTCVIASLVRKFKAVKSFCPWCNDTLKADIAIAYCKHKNCRFGNEVSCNPKISVSL